MRPQRQSVEVNYWQRLMTSQDQPEDGWFCWVFTDDEKEFSEWMSKHCPNTEIHYRFNSGDPMFTVTITDEKEAVLFQLKWRS